MADADERGRTIRRHRPWLAGLLNPDQSMIEIGVTAVGGQNHDHLGGDGRLSGSEEVMEIGFGDRGVARLHPDE